jgi:tryptophan 2,3-dioxygenase
MSKHPPIGYSDYLQVEKLLQLQKPRSQDFGNPSHDEMLFIVIHQTYELWFKQILSELDSILPLFNKDNVDERALGTVVARLGRIIEIQKILIDQVRVLETMTPLDFLEFRDYLFPASGFQSLQFRLIENKLGLPRTQRLPFNAMPYTAYVNPTEKAQMEAAEKASSLFDGIEKWLERTPFLQTSGYQFWNSYRDAVEKMFEREKQIVHSNSILNDEQRAKNLADIEANLENFRSVCDEKRYSELQKSGAWRMNFKALHAALLINLYRDQPILHLPFKILVSLQDIDEQFAAWRYRHALMAHRMLGSKIGTGGSSGHRYLKAATDQHRIYGDLFNLATFLIPRSALPEHPEDVRRNLGFFYSAQKR